MKVNVQDLYDVVEHGVKVHRGTLRDTTQSLMDARLYTPLESITLFYKDEKGENCEVSATDSSITTIRIKILALFVHCERYDYSRSSRERLKVKLGLSEISCSNYMPEIIDGKIREWTVDNLKDAIAAFNKK